MLKHISLVTACIALTFIAGCTARVTRTYDPYNRDYHVWSNAEVPYYNTWVIESHHPNVEFRRLRRQERENYWRWRHDHR